MGVVQTLVMVYGLPVDTVVVTTSVNEADGPRKCGNVIVKVFVLQGVVIVIIVIVSHELVLVDVVLW